MTLVSDIRRVHRLLEPQQKRRFVLVLAFMVLAALLQVASVASIYPFLSVVANPSIVHTGWFAVVFDGLHFPSVERFLAALALLVFFLVVLSNGVVLAEKWLQAYFQRSVNHTLSLRLLKTYLLKDYSFFLHRNSSDLNRNVLADTGRISGELLQSSLNLISSSLIATGLVALLLVANPVSTMVVIGIIGGGYLVAYAYIRYRLEDLGKAFRTANEARFKTSAEAFGGVKDVKILGREKAFIDRFEPWSQRWAHTQAKYNIYQQVPKYAIETLAMGGLLVVLAILLMTGAPISAIIPLMGLFVFAGYRLMPVFRELLTAMSAFRFNQSILEGIEDDLGEEEIRSPALAVASKAVEPLPFQRLARVQNATFWYPKTGVPVLRNISIDLPKNKTIAFVGETGAGKTTLVDLILGLYEPQEGRLLVDEVPVDASNVRRWQRNLGYVPQDIYLTDDTVRNNIAFGLVADEIDDNAVQNAAKIAHIHEFIVNELPGGYDTIIGERGIRLSGGQRQRIGIARALYHDPEVLVLDEATSDIDNVTEANITAAIEELSGNKTLVIIAHRLSTIRNADRIYVLDHGHVVGEGTYDELVARNKAFMDLAQTSSSVVPA